MMSSLEPSCKTELWRFLLLRTIHDLGNSISGILTLSTHHLRNELPPEEVIESFKLIQESAESARQMLLIVGSLIDDESQGPELIRVSEFLHDLSRQMERIVPRSVGLQLSGGAVDALIEVDSSQLRQAFFALVAADCLALGARAGNIRLGQETESGRAWIVYSSEHKADSEFGHLAREIFEKLKPSPDITWSETAEGLRLRIGYLPTADFAAGLKPAR
ncbi:MAG TPA: hypothetical protein VE242_09415 [Chthoniobacterales bacterium]|nr:hypothetical protein [Chthoniobacterales bacterium]